MKKSLALVLALVMVLALVPTAFAGETYKYDHRISPADGKYKVEAVVMLDGNYLTAEYDFSKYGADGFLFDNTAVNPKVEIAVPFDSIQEASRTSIWGDITLDVSAVLYGLGGKDPENTGKSFFSSLNSGIEDVAVKVDDKKLGDDDDWDWVKKDTSGKLVVDTDNEEGRALKFKVAARPVDSKTYNFPVEITSKREKTVGDDTIITTYKEVINFSISFKDLKKTDYDLKFLSTKDDTAVLKDGIWFVDSATNQLSGTTKHTFNVRKNDGSKFTNIAYYGVSLDDYAIGFWKDIVASNTVKDSQITFDLDEMTKKNDQNADVKFVIPRDEAFTVYVTVEEQYAIYKGKIKMKYRTNVKRTDPKGISFAKSEYTMGIHQVLELGKDIKFTSPVPVYTHDLHDFVTLYLTDASDKSVIDIDEGKKIIGLREGVVYVRARYEDYAGAEWNMPHMQYYSDVAKITVSGTWQMVPEANWIVKTAGGKLNVRASASTKSSILGTLNNGDKVKVVDVKDGWAKIITDKYTNAYVSTRYLVAESSGSTSTIGSKTVIARVLNVRSGAGTSFSIVGKLSRNTKVEVVEYVANGTWAKINYNGGTAYVSNRYLK